MGTEDAPGRKLRFSPGERAVEDAWQRRRALIPECGNHPAIASGPRGPARDSPELPPRFPPKKPAFFYLRTIFCCTRSRQNKPLPHGMAPVRDFLPAMIVQ